MQKTLKSFEYDTLLERVSSFAHSSWARRAILSIRPDLSWEEVEERLDLIEEALSLKKEGLNPPLFNAEEYFSHLGKLKVEGSHLSPQEILSIRQGLWGLCQLDQYVKGIDKEKLSSYIGKTHNFSQEVKTIDRAITPSGNVKDSASPRLSSIRRELSYIRGKILSKLEAFFPKNVGFDAIRDEFVTIRNGRFVIPVKVEKEGLIKGIIHDRSKTGKTYYVEPFEVVDLNNKYRDLLKDEEEEVLKILLDLSNMLRERLQDIEESLQALYKLDFIWALAEFSQRISGKRPIFSKKVRFNLKDSFNPILYLEKGEETVPFSLYVDKDFKGIVVSGPNGGGKTVFLKAIGLITAMAKSGLFVPGSCEPEIYPFKNIFSYISDEQNISSSLSTYTAFLTRMKEILDGELEDSLVILDELGEGTDVEEGSSLGIAILEELRERGAFFVVSTHQMPIKGYGEEREDIRTISFLFDEETKRPTFKLFPGIPGSSRALDVATTIGLPKKVVERARELVPEVYKKGEGLLKKLEDKVRKIDAMEEGLKKLFQEATNLISSLKKLHGEMKNIRRRVREEVYEELKPVIREAKRLLKEARKGAEKRELERELKEVEERVQDMAPSAFQEALESYTPSPGDTVELAGFKKSFVVLSVDYERKKAKVESGALRMEVPFSMLTRAKEEQFNKGKEVLVDADRSGVNVIKVIGKTREDAILDIEKFLDKALVSGWREVKVIHGIGTGRLKEGIWNYFSKHPLVKKLRRDENPGVTIIEVVEG